MNSLPIFLSPRFRFPGSVSIFLSPSFCLSILRATNPQRWTHFGSDSSSTSLVGPRLALLPSGIHHLQLLEWTSGAAYPLCSVK